MEKHRIPFFTPGQRIQQIRILIRRQHPHTVRHARLGSGIGHKDLPFPFDHRRPFVYPVGDPALCAGMSGRRPDDGHLGGEGEDEAGRRRSTIPSYAGMDAVK